MKYGILLTALLLVPALVGAQQSAQPTVKTSVDEVLLDLIVRDKKGHPVSDLAASDLTITDNGARQKITSFRLVKGSEAITETGTTQLDPLRQIRLVTLAFDPLSEPDQRKRAREASLDLIKGEQGANVYYSVVMINTRLLVLQPFTNDRTKLAAAVERATSGASAPRFVSESEVIQSELRRQLGGGANNSTLLDSARNTASQTLGPGTDNTSVVLARVMLDMLRMDEAAGSQGTRMTLSALKALVLGLQTLPGRKSVLYFTWGIYLGPELDIPFRNLIGMANRANVTFYSVDTRGVTTYSDNAGATNALNGAASAASGPITSTSKAASKEDLTASDRAESSGRNNIQLPLRDLAESTGGFLIGESNDLRTPLRKVNEEVASYYEVSWNPGLTNFDGSFRKLQVSGDRKDLVIHARTGYFALPPDARAAGLQTFEVPLLKALSEGRTSSDVKFRAGALQFQPKAAGTDTTVIVEIPLRELQPRVDPGKPTQAVHCSVGALIKDSKGQVVQKLTRDRNLQVTPEQLKLGNLIDKMSVSLPPGAYTLESAVLDRESGKIGLERESFQVAQKPQGVGISSMAAMRSYTPNAKDLDPAEPFQFQGGIITPTLDDRIARTEKAMLRIFFVVYQDAAIKTKPTVEVEFLQNGKSLTKVPMALPEADLSGRIPYLMTIPANGIPPGTYEIRATAHQGDTSSQASTSVKIEAL